MSSEVTAVRKQDVIDPVKRIESLMDQFEKNFASTFLLLIRSVKNELAVEEIAAMLEAGRIEEAVGLTERAISKFSDAVVVGVVLAGQDTAEFIGDALKIFTSFDQTNFAAVEVMRQTRLRLVSGLSETQREAVRSTLVEGIRQGLNPREQARRFKESIGLTPRQVEAINNYRRALEANSVQALNRQLRDARFDSTVRNAAATDTPLTREQINRMVLRYTERHLKHRSQVIARTESLSAAHVGSELMYQQAIADGRISPNELESTWLTARDKHVRHQHDGMNGQKRNFGESFISDAGTRLAHPGDPKAPVEETAQCRCILTRRIKVGV